MLLVTWTMRWLFVGRISSRALLVYIFKYLSVSNGPCKRQQAEGQVEMWPFQNQQVWTGPLPAERASWCLTRAAFNDCLRAESSTSDNLCTNLPLWLETQAVMLPFAPCECWQSCYYKLILQKVIFFLQPPSPLVLYFCLHIHVPTNAVTLSTAFMCLFAVGFSFNQQNMTLFPVWRLWCFFFMYWQ